MKREIECRLCCNITEIQRHALTTTFSSVFSAAFHGLSILFPLSLFIIFHLFCPSVVTFPLVLVL